MGEAARQPGQEHSRTAALLEQLRGQIRRLEAQPRQLLLGLRTGVREVDELGVFRLGAGVELTGEEASGRTTLALSVVAGACREKRLAAWVDGPAELYPPAAVALGVELERLLIVRPGAPGQLVWSAVQLLRSGAFSCVVLDVTHTGLALSLTDTKKLLDAARAGGALLLLVTSLAAPAQGLVRLTLRERRASPVEASHLRCLDGGAAAGPEYELEAPHGRRARVARERLARGAAVPLRRSRRVGEAPPVVLVEQPESLQRPRKHRQREGYGVIPGAPAPIVYGRPGRDAPLHLPGRSWR
jgi:hypothetical protein